MAGLQFLETKHRDENHLTQPSGRNGSYIGRRDRLCGLTAAVDEGVVAAQLSKAATFAGRTGAAAFAIGPEWSEELGASVTGRVGFSLKNDAALGVIVTAGERKREALLNFGVELDAQRQVVFTAGQLQEKLEFGTEGAQEWVKQNAIGVAYDASRYAFKVSHVDSETTDNFVGAKSTGAEMTGRVAVSEAATLELGAGYQSLTWDDATAGSEGLTASLDMSYQLSASTRLNVFADHNMSENQLGFGGSWALGAGTLAARYTFIEGRAGAVTDDNRLAVTFAMPLGGKATTLSTRGAPQLASAPAASTLLSDVMTRPGYLPQRVIVKAAESSCTVASAVPVTWVQTTDRQFQLFVAAIVEGTYTVTWIMDGSVAQPSTVLIENQGGLFGTFPEDTWADSDFYTVDGPVSETPKFLIEGESGCFYFGNVSVT